jgi:hypothetical protein
MKSGKREAGGWKLKTKSVRVEDFLCFAIRYPLPASCRQARGRP